MKEVLSFGYSYDTDTDTLEAVNQISNYGLFSTVILLAAAASRVHKKYGILPSKVKAPSTLQRFKDKKDDDIFSQLFTVDETVKIPEIRAFNPDVHHSLYRDSLIKAVSPYIRRYGAPNESVKTAIIDLKARYDLDNLDRVSVIYRGSDKWTDKGGWPDAGPGAYVRMTNKLKIADKNLKVLIQSEEMAICKFFRQKYKAFFIPETAVGDTKLTTRPIPELDRGTWLKYFIASLHIHSESKHVITYTGNSGFFVVALRGHTENVLQECLFSKKVEEIFYNDYE